MKKNNVAPMLLVFFALFFISIQALATQYEFQLSSGVTIKLNTKPGDDLGSLLSNNGGLYVSDFHSIDIILPQDLQGVIDTGCAQSQAMFLHQLTAEYFLTQQPYEVFIFDNNVAPSPTDSHEPVSTVTTGYECFFRCGAQFQDPNSARRKHYIKHHFDSYQRIREKCSSSFNCRFCRVPRKIESLRELGAHIRHDHPDKGYSDFLP